VVLPRHRAAVTRPPVAVVETGLRRVAVSPATG